jgi:endogenous inhibitor of DNA gyrase (YacG/DUF329 family)
MDLGQWATESYRIAAEEGPAEAEDEPGSDQSS